MNLPGFLALKNAGKAEDATDNIYPGWKKTIERQQRNEDMYETSLKCPEASVTDRLERSVRASAGRRLGLPYI